MSAIPFSLAFVMPACAALGLWLGGGFAYAVLVFSFVLIPIFEPVIGVSTKNPSNSEVPSRAHAVLLILCIPVQIGAIVWTAHSLASTPHTLFERIGLVASMGVLSGGFGINVAHELMHRKRPFERAMAEILMTSVSYPHFIVEHVLGHHKNVGTKVDPATARLGESVYLFLPRTLFGSLASAWRLESKRVSALGIRPFGLRDRRLRYPLDVALALGVMSALFGWTGAAFFLAQGFIAVVLLETINYVEHYGLERKEVSPGHYERVRNVHSWNSSHRVSCWYLFNLPRHSDHHAQASRPYPLLRHTDDSPQLPAGYGTLLMAAFVPPLWRHMMDGRAHPYRKQIVGAESSDA